MSIIPNCHHLASVVHLCSGCRSQQELRSWQPVRQIVKPLLFHDLQDLLLGSAPAPSLSVLLDSLHLVHHALLELQTVILHSQMDFAELTVLNYYSEILILEFTWPLRRHLLSCSVPSYQVQYLFQEHPEHTGWTRPPMTCQMAMS